eukprot:GFUD01137781.1.p1 GENE.GFUD01137781.1~~GFUD01137781.1.p1  ORF type:complete len:105 (+),score=13.93 GFUD01137781.1:136-450(+)
MSSPPTPRLQKLVTPVTQALVAICRLLSVCSSQILDPLHKQILVFLQQKELSQHYICLVKPLAFQPLAQHITNTSQVGDGLLPHGLGHEIPMLLRSGRHLDLSL